jgi:DNA-binding CsgD family transcriptional regulator
MTQPDPHSRRNRPWSDEENETIRQLRGKLTVAEIAAQLNRTKTAVRVHIHRLKLAPISKADLLRLFERRSRQPRRWTKAEDDTIRQFRGTVSHAQIGAQLNRTPAAVSQRATNHLKLPALPRATRTELMCAARGQMAWTEGKTALLRQLRSEGKTLDEIADALNRTRLGVKDKCQRLGVRSSLPQATPPWTPAEDRKLRVLRAKGVWAKEIARILGRKEYAVEKRCSRLGIRPAKQLRLAA